MDSDTLAHAWPLYGLQLHTPDLVLRLATDAELCDLALRARGNILPAERADWMGPWTQLPAGEFERSFLQFHWSERGRLAPEDWSVQFGVFPRDENGRPQARAVGMMGLGAKAFSHARSVRTGSWLVKDAQGRGYGTQMRHAVVHFAFVELGAYEAHTGYHPDNLPSAGVSRRLGYQPNGQRRSTFRLHSIDEQLYRLDRSQFQPMSGFRVEGLTADVLALLGRGPE